MQTLYFVCAVHVTSGKCDRARNTEHRARSTRQTNNKHRKQICLLCIITDITLLQQL